MEGTCMLMCPDKERKLREREGLLHRFEIVMGRGNEKRQADPLRTVKCFSRPAAGMPSPTASDLRPKEVLLRTVEYLMQLCLTEENIWEVYEFVSDRLRAIRQDMTILRIPPKECIVLLDPMIRFHVTYGYMLFSYARYDNTLNLMYLNECILKYLDCAEVCPEICKSCIGPIVNTYLCMNINNPELILRRLYKINKLEANYKLLHYWSQKNYIRVFKHSAKLDLLPRIAIATHLNRFRDDCLRNTCIGFSSINSKFPIKRLAFVLLYNTVEDVQIDCLRLGIACDENFAKLNKNDLKTNSDPQILRSWWMVDQQLSSDNRMNLLLNGFYCGCLKSTIHNKECNI